MKGQPDQEQIEDFEVIKTSDLSTCDLTNSCLANSDLADSVLAKSNLPSSGLANSDLAKSNLDNSNLAKSDIAYNDLANSDLAKSDIAYNDLANSDLANRDLANTDLANSDIVIVDTSKHITSITEVTTKFEHVEIEHFSVKEEFNVENTSSCSQSIKTTEPKSSSKQEEEIDRVNLEIEKRRNLRKQDQQEQKAGHSQDYN